ncbi:hypothetical protein Taro_006752, partial [Colocasia esculenta]|nr:hypothetical protein [Colocasia esculenta]
LLVMAYEYGASLSRSALYDNEHFRVSRSPDRVCGGLLQGGKPYQDTDILLLVSLCPSILVLVCNLHSSVEMLLLRLVFWNNFPVFVEGKGAVRRLNAQRKTVEIESVAVAGKAETQHGMVKKYFHLEFLEKEHNEKDEDVDIGALENGFVTVTPINLPSCIESESAVPVSEWLSSALSECQKSN